jgi:hypothetical protein
MPRRSWFSRLFHRDAAAKAATTRRHHRLPLRLEALEDRCLPSTYHVTNNLDDGSVGSLRWAVNQVNAAPDTLQGDIIQFAGSLTGGQTITLGSTLTINGASTSLTITDQGGAPVTIDGNKAVQVINSSRDLVLDSLTITNGAAGNGAGVLETGNIAALNCTFTGNVATGSGNSGPKSVSTALGGAIDGAAAVTLIDCVFSDNSAASGTAMGGAVYGAAVSAINCTLSGNSVSGGGYYFWGDLVYNRPFRKLSILEL